MFSTLIVHGSGGGDHALRHFCFLCGEEAAGENKWSDNINHKREIKFLLFVTRFVLPFNIDDSCVVN